MQSSSSACPVYWDGFEGCVSNLNKHGSVTDVIIGFAVFNSLTF
jgi:hypothetical protein